MHEPAERGVEISFHLVERSGTGKERKRSAKRLAALPTACLDNCGPEHAERLHKYMHDAVKAFLRSLVEDPLREPEKPMIPGAERIAAMVAQAASELTPPGEPVIEIRPSRPMQDLSGAPRERSEEAEIAEGMRNVQALNR